MGYRKLGRKTDHRNLMLRNLATDLIVHGHITTTVTRAKEVSKLAERLVTMAKKDTLHSRRNAARYVMPVQVSEEQTALQKLFDEIGPQYAERNGGYTRIIKTSYRRGDNAPQAIIEFV